MQLTYCLLLHIARRLMQAYTHPSSTPVTTAHVWQGRRGVKSNLWKWCCAPEGRSLTVACPPFPAPFTCQGGWITPLHVARLKLNGGRTASQVQSSQMVIPDQHSFQHQIHLFYNENLFSIHFIFAYVYINIHICVQMCMQVQVPVHVISWSAVRDSCELPAVGEGDWTWVFCQE